MTRPPIHDFDFTGRSALVTGAASGIGRAVALWLAARGAERLILLDRDGEALGRIDPASKTELVTGDVTDPVLWDALDLAGLDHAVLNAGIATGGQPITGTDLADFRRTMAVNVEGVFLGLRAAMAAMANNGGTSGGGSIVVSSSVSGIKPYPGTAAYATSKAAAIQLMKVAAAEGASAGIRVNAIAPGPVDTPIWDKSDITGGLHGGPREAMMAKLAKGALLNRVAQTEEIAAAIGFLLSDLAANITGIVLQSDGGATLRV